jgi:hypothetical protein
VSDFGLAALMETIHGILHHAVGVGDTFVLAQMFHPRFDQEGFNHSPLFGGVFEDAPGISAVTTPRTFELDDGFQECLPILWPNAIFDRHQYRPAIVGDALRRDRCRPMHRRRQIDVGAGLQLPAPGERDGDDRAGRCEKMCGRQSEPCGYLGPCRAAERQATEEYRRISRRLSSATEDEFSPLPDLLAAGMTDYVAIITRFAAEGVIGEMDGVYSSWTTRAPGGFNDCQIAALQRIVPYLALAIKSVSLARMTGTLMETYLGRDAGRAFSADGSCGDCGANRRRHLVQRFARVHAYHRYYSRSGNSNAERLFRCDRLGNPRAWR